LRRTMIAAAVLAVGFGTLSACASDTSKLKPGDCVQLEGGDAIDFTFGGDVNKVACDDVEPLSGVYRVKYVGSSSEVERNCRTPDVGIIDEGDAACLAHIFP
jgi:hypothetical protein